MVCELYFNKAVEKMPYAYPVLIIEQYLSPGY